MAPSRTVKAAKDKSAIRRPANAWILYRTDKVDLVRAERPHGAPPIPQAEVSKIVGQMWANETAEVRGKYEQMAEIEKKKHKEQYPDYKYQPMKKEVKLQIRAEAKRQRDLDREAKKAAKGKGRVPSRSSHVGAEAPSSSAYLANLVDPIDRGIGPSPPLSDTEDDSCSSLSTPSFGHYTSPYSGSHAGSPYAFGSSKTLPTHPSEPAASSSRHVSPVSAAPTLPQPAPSYAGGFEPSPAPSRQASYRLDLYPPSAAMSPAETPRQFSGTEDILQSWQPSGYAEQPSGFAELPPIDANMLSGLGSVDQAWPGRWIKSFNENTGEFKYEDEVTIPMSMGDQLQSPTESQAGHNGLRSFGSMVYKLEHSEVNYDPPPLPTFPNPPTHIDVDKIIPGLGDGGASNSLESLNMPGGFTALLNIPECLTAYDDAVASASSNSSFDMPLSADDSDSPFILEQFSEWLNANPENADAFTDPSFYENLANAAVPMYPHLVHQQHQLPPMQMQMAPIDDTMQGIDGMNGIQGINQMDGMNGTHDMNGMNGYEGGYAPMGGHAYGIQFDAQEQMDPKMLAYFAAAAAAEAPQQQDPAIHNHNHVVVPSPSRYVPPAGAGVAPKRRVGGSWRPPAVAKHSSSSDEEPYCGGASRH